ncbi:MAG TPA: M20/M25/M40 family metallo-hydrolase [Gemmatimonadaceae bacterium]|jgi:N-acetylated-alpha-linked acidic dipeptidase|nr:M20/M25/M40 family metallo-hydrolase [Gemmatimonadaceae bacterium]
MTRLLAAPRFALPLAVLAAATRAQAQAPLPGYTATGATQEQALEAKTATLVSATRASAMSHAFSLEPHMAGSPAQARTRDLFAGYLWQDSIRSEVRTYNIYLPYPTSVHLYRVSPNPTELPLAEGPLAEDSTSFSYPQILTFNGYGAAGDVTGEVVYVNYGLIEDYKTLDSLGISVRGKIAIARYGKSYRGIKAREAEKHGAIGLMIYSDPAEDGYTRGDVYPEGPMRSSHGVQRGSVYNDNGDPTTPDYPSLPGAKRIPLSQTSLPRIPVIPISYGNATELLQGVRGEHWKELPKGWQGALPFRYHIGPGPVQARMIVTTDAQTTPYKDIWDVLGTIRGSEFPDELVVIGGHRDAWGPGATDNVSGTVSVLEAAHIISDLMKQGYRPKRTIVFASWDAEEWGCMGSVEFVEQDSARLWNSGVAYFNQDMVAFGPDLGASGSPSLRPMFRDIAKHTQTPDGHGTVYEAWRTAAHLAADTLEPSFDDPGGGSDFAGFYNHLGIPIMDWGFNGSEGIYHSAYDSYHWLSTFGDPGFRYHATTAQMSAMLLLRMADADILPYDYVEYAKAMRVLADTTAKAIAANKWTVPTTELTAAIARMDNAAHVFNAVRDSALAHPSARTTATRKQVNALLLQVERAFVRPTGLKDREWFRNVIYAADNDNGYANIGFPTINEAVRAGDQARTVREIADLAARFDTATRTLISAAQSLR